MKRITVGMSGGVDSAVAASILIEQGYDVEGLFMKNWEEDDDGTCNSRKDYGDAKRVCNKLGIKLFSINLTSLVNSFPLSFITIALKLSDIDFNYIKDLFANKSQISILIT